MNLKASLRAADRVPNCQVNVITPAVATQATAAAGAHHPSMTEALARIEAAAARAGLPLGGVAFSEDAAEALIARGYRMIVGFDLLWLRGAVERSVAWGRR